jgi:hypothetical protein
MFAVSREAVPARSEYKIQAKKTMITVFFTHTRLMVLDALPHGQTLTQEYFITDMLPCDGKKSSISSQTDRWHFACFTWIIPGAITARG